MEPITVAVFTGNRRLARVVKRSLASLGWEVVAVPFVREEIGEALDGPVKLVLVDADDPAAETRWLLGELARRRPGTSALLLTHEVDNGAVGELLAQEKLNNVVGAQVGMSASPDAFDEAELMVSCQKLVTGDIFGLEKYLTTWGTELYSQTVRSTPEKESVIAAFETFLRRIDTYGRIVSPISMVVEELIMNGLFDAPRDAQGRPKYATRERRELLEVEPAEAVQLCYGCDGRYVGVAVSDPFGALDREAIVHYLGKFFLGEQGAVQQKEGGAGLGLFMVFNSITQLAFNIDVGKRTEVVALFYVRDGARGFKSAGRSLHIFVR